LRGRKASDVQDSRGYLCNILSSALITELAAHVGLCAEKRCYRIATSLLEICTMLPILRPFIVWLRRREFILYVWAYKTAILLDKVFGSFHWLGERVSGHIFIGFEKA
jgi:hypothetical protein